jgi:hypothetical protein
VSKPKAKVWTVFERNPLGIYVYDSRGIAGRFSYLAAVYELTEYCGEGEKREWRKRTEQGEALYAHDHDFPWFSALANLYQLADFATMKALKGKNNAD